MSKYVKQFLVGTGIGLITPFAGLFVYWLFVWRNIATFIPGFFVKMYDVKLIASHFGLACVLNLPLFYLFMNKDKYKTAQGIIFGTLIYAFYIFYYKLFVVGTGD
ncbi:MAG: hypothetical protein IAF38_10750 [Bacteroidia bacterium]|nr:hypothetical protein [Bacteroidia bacterium]